jgi:hypothetical protein
MKSARPAFPVRMMYAPSLELIDYARRLDFNWAVVHSDGHTGGHPDEDAPVYMPGWPRVAAARRAARAEIESRRERVRARIAAARRAGLKTVYHAYEPSLPAGFREAYAGLWSPEIHEYRRLCPDVRRNRNLCLSRPEVREALSAKVAETVAAFPGLDAFMYTNNETSSATKAWHRCDRCRDIPFGEMMEFLHDTMQEGLRRAGGGVRLISRAWGTHEPDYHYAERYADRLEFGVDAATERWLRPYVKCFADPALRFRPSRDIPAWLRRIRGRETAVIYKASWADTNLHHPLNPWIGRYRGHQQICELSFEYCRDAPRVFYVMGREMQRRARLCARQGVEGLCAVPVCWGAHDNPGSTSAHPSRWSLAGLNVHLFAALAHDPEADLEAATADWLKGRYGRPLPRELAVMLLDSEDVAAGAQNVLGARCTGKDFHDLYYSLLRYAPMRRNWRARMAATPEHVARVERDKAAVVARARDMLGRIERLAPGLPPRAAEEFRLCFGSLLRMARDCAAMHTSFMRLRALRDGHLRPTTRALAPLLHISRAGD